MMIPAILALILLAPSGSLLRYKFTPGITYSIVVTEESETTVQTGDGRSSKQKQTVSFTNRMKVLSAAHSEAVLEEHRVDARRQSESENGKAEAILPPVLRQFHITPLGRTVKVEHKPIAGVPDAGPGFLEGFSIPLAEKAVQPGATWSGLETTRGMDGRPIAVRYTGHYARDEMRNGHNCAKIESTLTSSFEVAQANSQKSTGTLTGNVTSWFAPDIGLDAESETNIELRLTSRTGATQRTVTIKSHGRQILKR